MKLSIIAIGSRGDVQPCVALGRKLVDAGHSVRIVTLESFQKLVQEHGLEFFPVTGDAQALTNELGLMQMKGGGLQLLSMYRGLMKTFAAITEDYHRAFSDPMLHDSEAILSQLPAGLYGYDLAEYLQVPYIALTVIPQEITGAWPISLFPSRKSFGASYNRLTYRLAQQMAWQPFRKPINEFRKALGLAPASFFWGNMRRLAQERVPVIQGFSEAVIPPQAEWGEHIHTTGYWILDEPDWQPSQALQAFLDTGDAPVFIGFGSMPVPDPQASTRLILDAFKQSGKRGILHSGWAKLGGIDLPDSVFQLDYAPYTWLFSRMASVIHHGGSGTTGLALRSGVPSMIVPFMADQPFWAERTYQLGVGASPIPFAKLTVENLAEAIQEMASNQQMRDNARTLAGKIQQDVGLDDAVKWIQHYLKA